MMQAFIAPLAELAEYQEILQKRRKEKGILQIAGCVNWRWFFLQDHRFFQ